MRFSPLLPAPLSFLFLPRWTLIRGGVGRICPGRILADASIWLAAAHIVAALDIRKARGPAGEEVTPEVQFASGSVRWVFATSARR